MTIFPLLKLYLSRSGWPCGVLVAASLVLLVGRSPAIVALPTPPGPEVVQGTARAEIVLNGLWRFQPLLPGGNTPHAPA